jgi:hypothetical protein
MRPVHAGDNYVMEYRSISAWTRLVLQRQKQNETQLVIIVHRHLFEVQYVYVDLPQ